VMSAVLPVSENMRVYNVLCEPSHIGRVLLCLQPQNHTSSVSDAVKTTGLKPLPLCEPSHIGWALLRPQAHQ